MSILRTITASLRGRRGSNAIEFALTLPVFLALILGLMDYGWFFANQAGLNNATSLGCRKGSMRDENLGAPGPAQIAKDEITALANPWCGGSGACGAPSTSIDNSDSTATLKRKTLVCKLTMTFNPLVGFAPTPNKIVSESRYRLEWQR